ncbi:MAG: hypothetical protein K2J07_01360, partial [Muribaculaceae bacterium]|nr:hypothetical protein [Muribaculaceae bacterium]
SSYSPQPFQTPGDHRRYGWSYYDLLDYASALLPGDTEIARAINEAVPLSLATPMLWNEIPITNHCGLSTLIIENADDPDLDKFNYRQLAWWRDVVSYRFSNP